MLRENKNERGIAVWERTGMGDLKTFGIGVTNLKKLAKKIGKNHDLAMQLYKSDYFDAKIIATLIDEPKQVTREQAEEQVDGMDFWMMSHTYCSSLLAKVPFQKELADQWIESENDKRRRAAWLMMYNIAKDDKKLDDDYFIPLIDTVEAKLRSEENYVKDAMNNALIMIGQRSCPLNERAIAAAKKIGKVMVDYGDNSCQALDAMKHLTGDRVKKKLAKK